jgi:hypothetical protein
MSGDMIKDEVLKVAGVSNRDLDQEVVAARDDKEGKRFGERDHEVPKFLNGVSGLGQEAHGNDCLHVAIQCGQIDLRMETGDGSIPAQVANAL